MKVIFLQNVKKVGQKNEVKEINDGYARNFLLPNKLAVEANPKELGELRKRLQSKDSEDKKNNKNFNEALEKLKDYTLVLKKKANKEGHLFSGISAKEISSELRKNDIFLDEDYIILESPIKKTGSHTIKIKSSSVNLNIEVKD